MVKTKSLINGIGNTHATKTYYDNWSNEYEVALKKWNYEVPKKCANLLKRKLKYEPKKILDLACGTGLFGEELVKIYFNCQIYGSDISKKSLVLAKKKNIYSNLKKINFEKKQNYLIKFDLVSMIGAMTYCKNFNKLFNNVKYYLTKKGGFLFSHRIDLWEKQNFDKTLERLSNDFLIKHISRPCNYLPLNKDFKDKIKIRLVLLEKI